jgi:hypothetical protein
MPVRARVHRSPSQKSRMVLFRSPTADGKSRKSKRSLRQWNRFNLRNPNPSNG